MIHVLEEPTLEPVTLAEGRRWLNMTDDDDTDQDPEILLVLKAMRRYAEKYTGRRFCDTELELLLDCWPGRRFEIPVAPLLAVNYVKYLDTGGTLQTLDASKYEVDIKSVPGRIQPAYMETWPSLRGGDLNAVQIGFAAGYGTGGSPDDLSVIPEELKVWLRIRLATLFENREAIIVGTIVTDIPRSHNDALLDPLMLGRRFG